MAAFERILSGFPQMDEVLNSIRLGDNVVWQISELEEFRTFAELFARQAVRDGRNVIYIRFAQHEPVLRDLTGIQVRRFDPDNGFEAFTILYGAVYNDRRTLSYDPELFQNLPELFRKICPSSPELVGMIQVREVENLYFWLDAISNHGICGLEESS